MRLLLLAVVGSVLVAAYAPDAPAALPAAPDVRPDSVWTWPERSENLQVLPDSTSAAELRAVMQSFTRALGVRCSECHVGEGRDFRTWDFASDAKPHKEVARGMMRMTDEINREDLPEALEVHDHAPEPHGEVHVHGDGTRHVHAPAQEHEAEHEHGAEHQPEHAELRVSCWTCHRGQREPQTVPPAETDTP